MPLVKRKTTVIAVAEATEGVLATVTEASDTIFLVEEATYRLEPERFSRALGAVSFAKKAPLTGRRLVRIAFKSEVVGSATADTEPTWGLFMAACGFKSTIVADTSVTYDPVTPSSATYGRANGNVSLTIQVYQDGVVKKARGCRGTVVIRGQAGGRVMYEWEFLGIYEAPSDTEYPSLVTGFDTPAPPILENAQFAFQGLSAGVAVIDSFSININNDLTARGDVSSASGLKSILVADRNIEGSIDPEQPLEADWSTPGGITKRFADGAVGGLSLVVGSDAGNTITISAPAAQVQISDESEGERNGINTSEVSLGFYTPLLESATDKELRIVHT